MNFDLTKINTVESVEDRSDDSFKRVLISFKNGYQLSVIRGFHSYGGDQGLFEIAPINLNEELDGGLLDPDDQGDDVLGWCDEAKVLYYFNKIGNL